MICLECGRECKNNNSLSAHLLTAHKIRFTDETRSKYGLPSKAEAVYSQMKKGNKKYRKVHEDRCRFSRKKFYEVHLEEIREQRKDKRENAPEVFQAYAEKWRKENPNYYKEKVFYRQAGNAVHSALRTGKLKKGVCEVCGCVDVQAHHCDYNKPLDVMWLCREHHAEWHRHNTPIYP